MSLNKFNIAVRGLALSAVYLFFLTSNTSQAASYTLTDLGTTAHVDADSGAGMDSWQIGGTEHLAKQWFYYRIGSGVQNQPINAIGASTFLGGGPNYLALNYANSQVSLTLTYILTGGGYGAGSADIQETIQVQNVSASPISFHFFQYSDFNLIDGLPNDTVEFLGVDSVKQTQGVFGIQEGIVTPPSSRLEAGYAGLGGTLDNLLNTPTGYDLNNNSGPITGDVTWSFQWDHTIQPGASLTILKDKTLIVPVIPEPTALSLIGLGIIAMGACKRIKLNK
jgi:hypothetical protein